MLLRRRLVTVGRRAEGKRELDEAKAVNGRQSPELTEHCSALSGMLCPALTSVDVERPGAVLHRLSFVCDVKGMCGTDVGSIATTRGGTGAEISAQKAAFHPREVSTRFNNFSWGSEGESKRSWVECSRVRGLERTLCFRA